MSNRIFQAVWDNGPQARSEMIVLMVLADCADAETGYCFPSYDHIARNARMSRATVHRVLAALVADGWVTYNKRHDDNGRSTSNEYYVSFEALGLQKLVRRSRTMRGQRRGSQNETPPSHCETGEGIKMRPPRGSQNETRTNHKEQRREKPDLFQQWRDLPHAKKPTWAEYQRSNVHG